MRMPAFSGIRPGVARLFKLAIRQADRTRADADEEIQLHLALRVEQLRAQGKALGADGGRLRRMVLGQVGRMTLIGGIIGLAGAIALGRAARSLLFQLEGHDPVTMVAAAGVIALVALAAAYVPAWRASRVDPMRALRQE